MTDSIILPVEAHQWVKSLFESLDRMHREGADHEQLANYVQRMFQKHREESQIEEQKCLKYCRALGKWTEMYNLIDEHLRDIELAKQQFHPAGV